MKTSKYIFITLIISLSNPLWIFHMLLLYPILVSRITLQHLSLTFIFVTNMSSKQFIMWQTSYLWKLDYSPLDVVLIKLQMLWASQKLLLLQTLYMLLKIFDLSLHSFQIYAALILDELRKFFVKDLDNYIKFWECPSQCK